MNKERIDAEMLWKVSWSYIKAVVDNAREPFLILDKDLRVLSANRTFCSFFQTSIKEAKNKKVYDLGNGQWDVPKLKILLEDILPKHTSFKNFKVKHDFPRVGVKIMLLNARQVYVPNQKDATILLAMEDITEQVLQKEKMRRYAKELELEVKARTMELNNRVKELERINRAMVGREMKMITLKKEIEKLKNQIRSGDDTSKNDTDKNMR